MAQSITFVFVFLKGSKEPTDSNDPNTWMLKYARARHTDVQVHKVLSVEEAIDIMLKELGTGDKNLERVYIYSHSNGLGYFFGRLKPRDSYGGISKQKAKNFLKNNKKIIALSKYAGTSANIYFRGCSLGKEEEALNIWRDIFGGKRGSGRAPDMRVLWGLEMYHVVAKKGNQVVFKKKINRTESIVSFVKELKKKYNMSHKFWQQYEDEANKELDKWLIIRYNFLKDGGELPQNMINIPDDKVVEEMRGYFDKFGGLPYMCLIPIRSNPGISIGSARTLLKKRGAIFPEDPNWSGHIKEIILPSE